MHVVTGLIPIASSFMDAGEKKKIMNTYSDFFEKNNIQEISESEISEFKRIYYFIITGGTEQVFLNLFNKRKKYYSDENTVLLAHSGNNSLPASLEILAYLENNGIKGEIVFLEKPNSDSEIDYQRTREKYADVQQKLRETKIGLIGDPSDWLIASSPDAETVKRIWGPEIIKIQLDELKNEILKNNFDGEKQYCNELVDTAENIVEPQKSDIENSVKIFLALKNLIAKYGLDSMTVRCFDLVKEMKITGCYALAQLNDENIIAACEADVVSNITMLWAYLLTGETPWMANPANINLERSKILLAHCTIARSLLTSYKLRSHFESGKGLGINGKLAPGPVTLLRVGGANLTKLWIAEGKLVDTGDDENLCRTQVDIEIYNVNKLQELLTSPLGNHVIMIRGHWRNSFTDYWKQYINPE